MVYLDNSATTKPCEKAVKKALEMMTENFGNPSSLHFCGFNAKKELEKKYNIKVSFDNIYSCLHVTYMLEVIAQIGKHKVFLKRAHNLTLYELQAHTLVHHRHEL